MTEGIEKITALLPHRPDFHERDAIEADLHIVGAGCVNRFDDSLGTSAAVPHGICSACRSACAAN
jgi:hypothetical protein